MSRFTTLTGMALAAAAVVSAPAMAQDAGITCMAGQYTQAQNDQILALAPNMANGTQINQPVFDQISTIAVGAIETCATQSGWSDQQTMFAIFYELGRVNERAFRASGALTQDELNRLDAGLAEGGNERLWQVIENSVRMGMGENIELTDADAMVMGMFITDVGLDVGSAGTDTPELAGMLLGFMGLQRYGEREFAKAGR